MTFNVNLDEKFPSLLRLGKFAGLVPRLLLLPAHFNSCVNIEDWVLGQHLLSRLLSRLQKVLDLLYLLLFNVTAEEDLRVVPIVVCFGCQLGRCPWDNRHLPLHLSRVSTGARTVCLIVNNQLLKVLDQGVHLLDSQVVLDDVAGV